jgi:hypothetical protein
MRKTIFCCDRCGEEIKDVVYVLSCYCEVVPGEIAAKHFLELNEQNSRQNAVKGIDVARHLCRKCKDDVTDGIFIV